MAKAGQLVGATIINDWQFANELSQYAPYVVLRRVQSAFDPGPPVHGDDADYQRGKDFFFDPFFWDMYQHASERVILQYNNENNHADANKFFLGLATSGTSVRRRVVIMNHSVGATDLTFDAQDRPQSPQWARHREVFQYCIAHGHFVGMHTYGQIDHAFHPVSATDNPGAARWYGLRFKYLYASMPDVQPDLLLNEKGPGKSELQRQMGFEVYWADHLAFEGQIADLAYLKAYMDWETGGYGAYGFEGDALDEWMPFIGQRLPRRA